MLQILRTTTIHNFLFQRIGPKRLIYKARSEVVKVPKTSQYPSAMPFSLQGIQSSRSSVMPKLNNTLRLHLVHSCANKRDTRRSCSKRGIPFWAKDLLPGEEIRIDQRWRPRPELIRWVGYEQQVWIETCNKKVLNSCAAVKRQLRCSQLDKRGKLCLIILPPKNNNSNRNKTAI